ncbi:hypothetical protein GCM10020000_14390 [Streptomyces olivoverticillatus]
MVAESSAGPPWKVAQVPSGRCRERMKRAAASVVFSSPHAEELTEQQVFGVHGDVGLQVALPPAALVLVGEQVVHGPGGGPLGGFPRLGRLTGRLGAGQNGCAVVGLGCAGLCGPGAVGRRCHGFP